MSTTQASTSRALSTNKSGKSPMTTKTLVQYLALTFALTWGLAALFLMFPEPLTAIFGEPGLSNPLVILAIYAPGIAGLLLAWRHYGLRGMGGFFRRLTFWRAPLVWWLFLLLGIPAVVFTGAAIKGTLGGPFPFSPWTLALPALAQALILGPIEEFGWRGLALPLLQRKFAPAWAGLILGVIWALWHIPPFMMGGMPQSSWSVAPFFLGIIAISVILTPLFNASRGSLLIAILYHFQMMNPLWPDAQPWDNILWVVAAVVIVWLNRRTMFKAGQGVTAVLASDSEAAPEPGKLQAARG